MSAYCKACSEKKPAGYSTDIFDPSGNPITLKLCREHDIELYKIGQFRFVTKYGINVPRGMMAIAESEDDEAIGDFS